MNLVRVFSNSIREITDIFSYQANFAASLASYHLFPVDWPLKECFTYWLRRNTADVRERTPNGHVLS